MIDTASVAPSGWVADAPGWSRQLADGSRVRIRLTRESDGDLRFDQDPGVLDLRRAAIAPLPWTALHQVHGSRVVDVQAPGEGAGTVADAAVTAVIGATLAVTVADCAPVGLWSPQGVIGVAHAGWRGLVEGVLDATVAAMRSRGATTIAAVLGPCIHPEAYEFGSLDLELVASRLGPSVVSLTRTGMPALDLVAGVRAALDNLDVELDTSWCRCTAEATDLWSWRARKDPHRQALVLWRDRC